ncbi:MAG: hypothetical protein RIS88_1305, partial [Pseudomonadota bacterium]
MKVLHSQCVEGRTRDSVCGGLGGGGGGGEYGF